MFTLFLKYNFVLVLGWQKSCKDSEESSTYFAPISPIIKGLHDRGAFTTKEPTLVRDSSLNSVLSLDFISFTLTYVFCSREPLRVQSFCLLLLWSVMGSNFPWLWGECWGALVFFGAQSALPCTCACVPFCSASLPFFPHSRLPASAFLSKVSTRKLLLLALCSRKSAVRLFYSRVSIFGTPTEDLMAHHTLSWLAGLQLQPSLLQNDEMLS